MPRRRRKRRGAAARASRPAPFVCGKCSSVCHRWRWCELCGTVPPVRLESIVIGELQPAASDEPRDVSIARVRAQDGRELAFAGGAGAREAAVLEALEVLASAGDQAELAELIELAAGQRCLPDVVLEALERAVRL